jgi:hypothetical protein
MMYRYLFFPKGEDRLGIMHISSHNVLGYVDLRGTGYRVETDDHDDVATVKSIDEVIPALLDYYEKHPTQWEGDDSQGYYFRSTPFGLLSVEQHPLGPWLAYRDRFYHLVHKTKPALFATAEEAQRAADAYVRNDLPELGPDDDDNRYSWVAEAIFAEQSRRAAYLRLLN